MELLFALIAISMIAWVAVPLLRRARGGREVLQSNTRAVDPAGGYGFVPVDQLDVRLPGPDPQLAEALQEVQQDQDWQAASRLLALTDDEWELRWQRVQTLAGAAAFELAQAPGEGGAWLRTWRAEKPKDVGGAEVHAEFLVRQAWMAGSAAADFPVILEEAKKVCAEAAMLAPGSPMPYIVELAIARGAHYREADFEELWHTVEQRAGDHMGAHLAALQYACEKWHGSREAAYDFAHRAAASAGPGTLLPALPLFAVWEHLPEANLVRGLYEGEVVTQAIEGAQYAVHHAAADHPMLPHVRHLLACFLVRAERYEEALEQMRHVDGYVGALPWSLSEQPAAEYAAYRALAVAGYEGGRGAALK